MPQRRDILMLVLGVGLLLVAAACQGNSGRHHTTRPPTDETVPTETQQPVGAQPSGTPTVPQLRISGPVSILSNSYGEDRDSLLYETVVVFTVTNPDPERAAVDAPVQVVLTHEDESLPDSSATGEVSIAPEETHVVVFKFGSPLSGSPPSSARFEIAASEDHFVDPDEETDYQSLPDDDWAVTDYEVSCGEVAGGCELLGDLTWDGDADVGQLSVQVVLRDTTNAEIIAAGVGVVDVESVEPGESLPFALMVHGFEQARPGGPIRPPDPSDLDAEFTAEITALVEE